LQTHDSSEVEQLVRWCENNNLILNTSKTKEMIVDFRKKAVRHLPLSINDQIGERVTSFCLLGTTIHQSLSWDMNISHIVNKAHQRLFFSIS